MYGQLAAWVAISVGSLVVALVFGDTTPAIGGYVIGLIVGLVAVMAQDVINAIVKNALEAHDDATNRTYEP